MCTFSIRSAPDRDKWCGPSRPRRPWTVHHGQNHTFWVTLLQRARRAAVLDQPSSLGTHWILRSLSSVYDSWTQGSHLEAIELYPGRSQAAVHNRGITRKKILGYYRVLAGHAFLAQCSSWWMIVYIYYTVLYNSSWKCHQLAAGQLLSGQPVVYHRGRI